MTTPCLEDSREGQERRMDRTLKREAAKNTDGGMSLLKAALTVTLTALTVTISTRKF